MKNLKIVVLESPYDSWNQPLAGDLLRDLIGTKLRGYGREYPYGVLPVDAADLISTHMSVCRIEPNGSFCPVMAIRWTSLKKSRLHYINFPGLSLVQQANAPDHVGALEKIISDADRRGTDLFYSGALSIEPSERSSKERSLFFRELLTMMYVNYQKETGYSELMAGGTIRFKVDKLMTFMGHVSLMKNDTELGSINVKHLAGEAVKVMHLKKFSFEAIKIARKWQHVWDERLVIKPMPITEIRKAG